MKFLVDGKIRGAGSVLLLTEVLIHPYRTGNDDLAQQYELILMGVEISVFIEN